MTDTDSLLSRIEAAEVHKGTVTMWWLLQAGFLFKTPDGTVILIDPYLSNEVEGLHGIGRRAPAPIDPEKTKADAILATHWHEDHLDPGSIRPFATASDVRFVGPSSCQSRVVGRGVDPDRTVPLNRGETTKINDVEITATFVRHELAGYLTEDAVGYILDFDGIRIFHSGDTEYDARMLPLKDENLHAAMFCINGTGGNMNVYEAALLAWQLEAPVVIPMHFGLWVEGGYGPRATLDPAEFESTYRQLGGQGQVVVPELGKEVTFPL